MSLLSALARSLRLSPSLTTTTTSSISARSLSLSRCGEAPADTMPKRPATPWVRFYTANYDKIKKTDARLQTKDIMKQLSTRWRTLPDSEKVIFNQAYEKDKVIYQKRVAAIPETELAEAGRESAIKRATKAKTTAQKELKALLTSLEKPVRTSSAYNLFIKHRMAKMTKDSRPLVEKTKQLAGEWKSLGDHQKSVYVHEAELDVERYKKEMVAWTNKMSKIGKLEDIVAAEQKLALAKLKMKDLESV